jgi:hypothetical protein
MPDAVWRPEERIMSQENLPQRTLKTTFWLVSFFTIVFAVRGELSVSFGLALGGALGIFSLWSLAFAIPRLFGSANPMAKFALGVLSLLKLPIYAGSLFFAMSSPLISPFAVFVGVAFVPVVVVLKVVTAQMLDKSNLPAGDEACRTKPALSK